MEGISQRDLSQYYRYIEAEKYSIQRDITTLFNESIKERFKSVNYTFDVIRYKKDKVKIIDFGLMDESVTKGTLFTYRELQDEIKDAPEFRYIGEDVGVQPKKVQHFCVPQEINEFFQLGGETSMMDALREEVTNQNREQDEDSNEDE